MDTEIKVANDNTTGTLTAPMPEDEPMTFTRLFATPKQPYVMLDCDGGHTTHGRAVFAERSATISEMQDMLATNKYDCFELQQYGNADGTQQALLIYYDDDSDNLHNKPLNKWHSKLCEMFEKYKRLFTNDELRGSVILTLHGIGEDSKDDVVPDAVILDIIKNSETPYDALTPEEYKAWVDGELMPLGRGIYQV